MNEGVQLKYGQIKGSEVLFEGYMSADQEMRQASGRFVFLHTDGRCTLNVDGSASILGGAEFLGEDATSADDRVNVNISLDAIYRIPVNAGTFVKAMIGKSCDISISSDIQGAQLDASAEDTLIIVDGDADNNEWVDVRINPSKLKGVGTGVV